MQWGTRSIMSHIQDVKRDTGAYLVVQDEFGSAFLHGLFYYKKISFSDFKF